MVSSAACEIPCEHAEISWAAARTSFGCPARPSLGVLLTISSVMSSDLFKSDVSEECQDGRTGPERSTMRQGVLSRGGGSLVEVQIFAKFYKRLLFIQSQEATELSRHTFVNFWKS